MEAIRQKIRYLGFVVDVGLPGSHHVTHALVNLEGKRNLWHVIELSSSRYPVTVGDSVGRYFRTVFSLSVLTWLAQNRGEELQRDRPVPGAQTEQLKRCARYLKDVDRADKPKAASPEFPTIRMAIHGSLFYPAGSKVKDTLRVIWKGPKAPTQIFFWTRGVFETSSLARPTDLPFGRVVTEEVQPRTIRITPGRLENLAVGLLSIDTCCSWQDLYLSALVRESEVQDFIDISTAAMNRQVEGASTHGVPEGAAELNCRSSGLLDLITPGIMLGVTGASGSGKSTVFRWVAGTAARRRVEGSEDTPFPILLRLKHFCEDDKTGMPGAFQKSIIESLDALSTDQLRLWEKAARFRGKGNDEYALRRRLLAGIGSYVEAWLEQEGSLSNVVLLVDGLGDVSPSYEYSLHAAIEDVLGKCSASIVSSKRVVKRIGGCVFQSWLGLQSVADDQMLWYLRQRFPHRAGEVVSELERRYPRSLTLLRRPFFLKVARQILDPDNLEALPKTQGALIKSFVEQSIRRRLKSKETVGMRIPPARFDHSLAAIAELMLSRVTSGEEPCVRYPSDLVTLGLEAELLDLVLDLGESVGVLRSSGLHHGEDEDQKYVAFEHDLFRDYFAAVSLAETDVSEGSRMRVDSLLEHKAWDEPLKMYIGLAAPANKYLEPIVERISAHDPYFAAECIESREQWKVEVVQSVLGNLERWELDDSSHQGRPFSNAGIRASISLRRRLPLAHTLSVFEREPGFSLAFAVAPEVLFGDPRIENKWDVVRLLGNWYQECIEFYLKGLASWKSPFSFELLMMMVDDIIVSQQCDLWSDTVDRLMRIVFRASPYPDYQRVRKLNGELKTAAMRHWLCLLTHCSKEDLESFQNDSDPVVRAVALFKRTDKTHDEFRAFMNHVSGLGVCCLTDPVMYFLVVTAAHTCPSSVEPVAVAWAIEMARGEPNAIAIRNTVSVLLACGTSQCYEVVADILLKSDPDVVLHLFSMGILNVSGMAMQRLLEQLRSGEAVEEVERALFMKLALTGYLSEQELTRVQSVIQKQYERVSAIPDRRDPEFELELVAAMKPLDPQRVDTSEMDEEVVAQTAPGAMPHLVLSREYRDFSEKLTGGLEGDYDDAVEMILGKSLYLCRLPLDELSRIATLKCRRCDDAGAFMKCLWDRARVLQRRGAYMSTFQLVYLARQTQIETGRRWLRSVDKYPWQ